MRGFGLARFACAGKKFAVKETSIPTANPIPEPYARGEEKTPFFVRGDVRHDVTGTSPSWWGPSGIIISTAADLGKAAKPLATGALLKEKGKKELLTWTAADQSGFEYGLHIEKTNGMIGHDGDVPGYQSGMCYLPDYDAKAVGLSTLYGWSVRRMPTNTLVKAAVGQCFPKPAGK